jgi:Rhodopirellula transposase DDE domain
MDKQTLRERFQRIAQHLDEKARRLWCANEAIAIGFGGVSYVAMATGVSRTTITEGTKEIKGRKDVPKEGIRRTGGGRKRKTERDEHLTQDVEKLVSPHTRGDPERPLRWSSKSTRKIADELNGTKKRASHSLVSRILSGLGYSLQANRKTDEGTKDNPDRDAQFQFINEKTKTFQKKECPILSVDTKKKENIGNFKNSGKEYSKKGEPEKVNVYDFLDTIKGKVAPYGVYDLTKNKGWVSVGISSDTAAFAVNSIRTWWHAMGKQEYPHAKEMLITADCGGSNGYRVRLWKIELQKLAAELNMTIHVSHFPPGTSKWNKIEHKLFCFISKNWRGKPLIDRATVVQLIGRTTTKTGLTVQARLDENQYAKGIKVSDEELSAVKLEKDDFHGEWNYTIHP